MNYTYKKVPGKNCYKVMRGSVVAAKCATLANAKKQVNLLNKLDFRTSGSKSKKK